MHLSARSGCLEGGCHHPVIDPVLDLTLAKEVTANLDMHTGACDPHCGMYIAVN